MKTKIIGNCQSEILNLCFFRYNGEIKSISFKDLDEGVEAEIETNEKFEEFEICEENLSETEIFSRRYENLD
jgi:hypothetical protein